MTYLLDTNILVWYLRSHPIALQIEKSLNPFSNVNTTLVSVVSVGEIEALGLMNNWGKTRMKQLENFLSELLITDINVQSVIDTYAEIDAYSQNRLTLKPLNNTPRNMGKNDLWIAATATITKAKLITTDKDFDHLNGVFFEVIRF